MGSASIETAERHLEGEGDADGSGSAHRPPPARAGDRPFPSGDPRSLREAFRSGTMPDAESLLDHEFLGTNFSTLSRVLSFERFVKGFFRSERESVDRVGEGYNRFVSQSAVGAGRVEPGRRHGYFVLRRPEAAEVGALPGPSVPDCLVIDYAASRRNHRLNPERLIRDYLVSLADDGRGSYLGAAYVGLGGTRAFSNFFLLEAIEA